MREPLETMVVDELEHVADQIGPDQAWTATVLDRMTRRRVLRRRVGVGATVLGVAVASLVVALVGSSIPERTTPAPADLDGQVDLGGRQMHLSCAGTAAAGAPTVLLDPDLGGGPRSFGDLPALLARELRVCTYDRAGTGTSDAATVFPRTAADLADDLAALVATGRVGQRVLLVSSGFSAMTATVFASEHPTLLAGVVLIDPVGPDVAMGELAGLGDRRPGEAGLVRDLRTMLSGDARSENGEHVSWPASEAQARAILDRTGAAFDDVPVTVVRSGRGREVLPPLPDAIRDAWWAVVQAGQRRYAEESASGDLVSIPGVVAAPATEATEDVVDAVRRLVP